MAEVEKIFHKQPNSGTVNTSWWSSADDSGLATNLCGTLKAIDDSQWFRRRMNLRHAQMYANVDMRGLNFALYHQMALRAPKASLTWNVCRACTDTAAAKIAKNKPRALFLTQRGQWDQKQRGKKLTQYVDGQFYNTKAYEHGRTAFTDGAVFGTGAVKVFIHPLTKKITLERAFIDEIVVDDVEGMYGKPRNIYQRKYYQRQELLAMFPKEEQRIVIERAQVDSRYALSGTSSTTPHDMLLVVEGWHLRSGPEEPDGVHAIALSDGLLFKEKYSRDRFPFSFYRWSPPLLGFYGTGICEELTGQQIEINKYLRDISESAGLFARPRIYHKVGSRITKTTTNQIASEYEYATEPPTFLTPQAMAPDAYKHLDRLYNRAFEITGISQMAATSTKPAGLDSGEALREYSNIETERFVLCGQRYEEFFMEVADQVIELTRELGDKAPKVQVIGGKWMELLDWSSVNLEKEAYVMKAYPASLLPTTPAGRMSTVQDMTNAGWIDKEQAMAMLDFPDVEKFTSLATAAIEDAEMTVDYILEKGEYLPPDPVMNLPVTLKIAQSAYLRAKVDQCDESRLELLRRFIEQVLSMIKASQPQPAPMPVAGPAAPAALPAPLAGPQLPMAA